MKPASRDPQAPAMGGAAFHAAPHAHVADAVEIRRRIERLRQGLVRLRVVRAVLLSLAAAAAALLVMRGLLFVSWWTGADDTSGMLAWLHGPAAMLIAGSVALLVFWWQTARWEPITTVRAALWFEERHPASHAVVTLMDDTVRTGLAPATESRLAAQAAMPVSSEVPASSALREVTWRAWRMPLLLGGAALTGAVLLSLAPVNAAAHRVLREGQGADAATESGTSTSRASRLTPWRIEITPPAYVNASARTLTDSGTVEALVGSRVRVSGRGNADGLAASWSERGDSSARSTPVAVSGEGANWQFTVTVPSRPAIVRVTDAADSRLLALVPRPDSLPLVRLVAPERDSVYRDTTGTLTLTAEVQDDIGLASAAFEIIVTSGSGEQYTARTITLGARTFSSSRTGDITARVAFGELGVRPGDVLHARAVARDARPSAAREAGISETRSLRFARADEYDSVAVDAAPPPLVDSSLLSQRMLLDLTEKLEARRPRITRETLVAESRRLAVEQARIRRAVSAIVFQRLSGDGESEHAHYEGDGHDHGLTLQEGKLVPTFGGAAPNVMPGATPPPGLAQQNHGDESPILAVNRPLLEAYNAMWDAGRALELADTRGAIPPMRLALEAIQRARAAERIYLRGRTRPVVVDLARVRLAGRDTGQDSRRAPSRPHRPARDRHAERLLHAAEQLIIDPVAARDSLMALRLDALADAPELSRAVEIVLTGLTEGRDVTDALVRARRTLVRPQAMPGLSPWSIP